MLKPARALVWLCIGLAVGLLAAAAAIAARGMADRVAKADLLVVPGNTVHRDGTLSDRLKSRLDAAVRIYRAGHGRYIFVSGAVGAEGVDESNAMRSYLVQQGVPAARIIQDPQGFNTEATAWNAATAMRHRGLRTAMAVTQYFHVPRLTLLLQRQGANVVGSAHAQYFEWRDAYSLAREVAAMAVLLVRPRPEDPALPPATDDDCETRT